MATIPPIPTTPPTTTPPTTPAAGLNGMTASDFLNLMITQLQQPDPLTPTDSNQLLTQMSQISQLQSNTQMQNSLQGMTLQQSIGSAGNLIGKTIQGLDDTGNNVQGTVNSVRVVNQKVYLALDSGSVLQMGNVTSIASPPATVPAA